MFEDIRPYNDAQASAALRRVAGHPALESISRFLYPSLDPSFLRETLSSITGVDDFQTRVMYDAVKSIIEKTTDGLTFGGLEHFIDNPSKRYLLLGNHRDIVLDSAFLQFILKDNHLPLSEIAVGDNLVGQSFVEDLMRSNRMVKVVRTGTPRELYMCSLSLSSYIRRRITGASLDSEEGREPDGGASIWVAHRQGRTKDGHDRTEQGLLKMLSLSSDAPFAEQFSQLCIMPVSISYEYEPCALRKALELWKKSLDGVYKKAPNEDLESIITGITQYKGKVHMEFCKPIEDSELQSITNPVANERFRVLAEIIDQRIVSSYRIFGTSVEAARMLDGEAVPGAFADYLEAELAKAPESCDREAVRKRMLETYAAPYLRKEKM